MKIMMDCRIRDTDTSHKEDTNDYFRSNLGVIDGRIVAVVKYSHKKYEETLIRRKIKKLLEDVR